MSPLNPLFCSMAALTATLVAVAALAPMPAKAQFPGGMACGPGFVPMAGTCMPTESAFGRQPGPGAARQPGAPRTVQAPGPGKPLCADGQALNAAGHAAQGAMVGRALSGAGGGDAAGAGALLGGLLGAAAGLANNQARGTAADCAPAQAAGGDSANR